MQAKDDALKINTRETPLSEKTAAFLFFPPFPLSTRKEVKFIQLFLNGGKQLSSSANAKKVKPESKRRQVRSSFHDLDLKNWKEYNKIV